MEHKNSQSLTCTLILTGEDYLVSDRCGYWVRHLTAVAEDGRCGARWRGLLTHRTGCRQYMELTQQVMASVVNSPWRI